MLLSCAVLFSAVLSTAMPLLSELPNVVRLFPPIDVLVNGLVVNDTGLVDSNDLGFFHHGLPEFGSKIFDVCTPT